MGPGYEEKVALAMRIVAWALHQFLFLETYFTWADATKITALKYIGILTVTKMVQQPCPLWLF